jgi:predicted nucleic acid-binding Zn ribbon protein
MSKNVKNIEGKLSIVDEKLVLWLKTLQKKAYTLKSFVYESR